MNKVEDPYGVLKNVPKESWEKSEKLMDFFKKYGSKKYFEHGLGKSFEEFEKIVNKPEYIEEPEEEEEEEEYIPYFSSSKGTNITYLLKFLKTKKIKLSLIGGSDKIRLLANLIRDFKENLGKSVNYACFLYNYFYEVELCDWPGKTEILEKLKAHLPKSEKTQLKAKEAFYVWWDSITTS